MPVPTQMDFLNIVAERMESRRFTQQGQVSEAKLNLLGSSLSYLYQISTCYPVCGGGDHIFESLAGRTFNHSLGSLRLISDYLFDESLNLTRSIAEITNLVFLLNGDPSLEHSWKSADRRKLMKEFSPAAVRKSLKRLGIPCPVSQSAYQELCELVTHPTPETKANRHDKSADEIGYIGGNSLDDVGYQIAFDKLLLYCSLSSMVFSKIVGQDINIQELADLGENVFSS